MNPAIGTDNTPLVITILLKQSIRNLNVLSWEISLLVLKPRRLVVAELEYKNRISYPYVPIRGIEVLTQCLEFI